MKSRLFQYIFTLTALLGVMYIMSHLGITFESHHPALNEEAEKPELYLGNVRHYLKEKMINRSLFHLEKTISSIRNLEVDFDFESVKEVEDAVTKLSAVYHEIESGSLITEDMNETFEYTLNVLAKAELKVSEQYALNESGLTRIALKYAYFHLKNAAHYAKMPNREDEQHVYIEIDSLIKTDALPPEEVIAKIDHMILEMDSIIARSK